MVYRAIDTTLQRDLAVKALTRFTVASSSRLRREGRVMASVSAHPNLATVYGVETFQAAPLLLLEYLPAGSLRQRLARAPLEPSEAISLGIAIASGLEHAHSKNILHRDIKPSNIAYSADGVPKLLDFGLAKLCEPLRASDHSVRSLSQSRETDPTMTLLSRDGKMIGTPFYMSPEALLGEVPDESFDLWSLGVVLYESLLGRFPIDYRGIHARTIHKILNGGIAPVASRCPHVPADFAALIDSTLYHRREGRPQSAAELKQQLLEIAGAQYKDEPHSLERPA